MSPARQRLADSLRRVTTTIRCGLLHALAVCGLFLAEPVRAENAPTVAETTRSARWSQSAADHAETANPDQNKTPIRHSGASADGANRMGEGPSAMWLVLFTVIAVTGVAALWSRRRSAGGAGSLPSNVLQVLGRRTLGQGHSVVLTRLGERVLLISCSPQGMNTLATIDDPVEATRITAECLAARPLRPLASLARRPSGAPLKPPEASPAGPTPFSVVGGQGDPGTPAGRRSAVPLAPETAWERNHA